MKRAYFQMHLAIFIWGLRACFGKLIQLNEGMLVWYRILLSWISFRSLSYREKDGETESVRMDEHFGIGILVMLHWLTFYGSIKLSSISVAMICLSSIALFCRLLNHLSTGSDSICRDPVFRHGPDRDLYDHWSGPTHPLRQVSWSA